MYVCICVYIYIYIYIYIHVYVYIYTYIYIYIHTYIERERYVNTANLCCFLWTRAVRRDEQVPLMWARMLGGVAASQTKLAERLSTNAANLRTEIPDFRGYTITYYTIMYMACIIYYRIYTYHISLSLYIYIYIYMCIYIYIRICINIIMCLYIYI